MKKFDRQSYRLKNYDYSSNGGYFITICTKYRTHFFGRTINDIMILSNIGQIVYDAINKISIQFPFAILDEFIIMPNHIHLIIFINKFPAQCTDAIYRVQKSSPNNASPRPPNSNAIYRVLENYSPSFPTRTDAIYRVPEKSNNQINSGGITGEYNPMGKKSLGEIIRRLKGESKYEINKQFPDKSFAWHNRYYDRIIRNEKHLRNIQNYIFLNPSRWHRDRQNKN